VNGFLLRERRPGHPVRLAALRRPALRTGVPDPAPVRRSGRV